MRIQVLNPINVGEKLYVRGDVLPQELQEQVAGNPQLMLHCLTLPDLPKATQYASATPVAQANAPLEGGK